MTSHFELLRHALRPGVALVISAGALLSITACGGEEPPLPSETQDDSTPVANAAATADVPGAPDAEPAVDQTPPLMVNGIAIDSDGALWVTDGLGSELLKLEAPGRTILARYRRSAGVDGPDDLVVDEDYVYYTANWTLAGGVGRLDRRTGQAGTFARTGLATNPIARLPSGRLLVGISAGTGGSLAAALNLTGLYEIDPTRNARPKRVVRDSKGINAFCIGPDGFVYGPTLHGVVRIDLQTGASKLLRDGFGFAASVRYQERDASLYVLDVAPSAHPKAPLLYRMALDGTRGEELAVLSAQPSAITGAADNFVIAGDGTFYVTRFMQPVITHVSADGSTAEDIPIGTRVAH